ncbi:MAG: type IV pilin protein [Pseudomonadota bacterium]
MKLRRQAGFTLIELMIVLVILGIVLAVGLPSYQDSVRRSTRADAQATLMELAQAMERRYSLNYNYDGAADGDGAPLPEVFVSQAPTEGQPFYDLTIAVADGGQAYTLRATPIAGSRQDSDGMMELTSLGTRRWDRDDDGAFSAAEQTWQR